MRVQLAPGACALQWSRWSVYTDDDNGWLDCTDRPHTWRLTVGQGARSAYHCGSWQCILQLTPSAVSHRALYSLCMVYPICPYIERLLYTRPCCVMTISRRDGLERPHTQRELIDREFTSFKPTTITVASRRMPAGDKNRIKTVIHTQFTLCKL